MNVLSVWRGHQKTESTADSRFAVGDTFLMTGTADQIRTLARDPDYIVLSDVSLTENLNRAPCGARRAGRRVDPADRRLAPGRRGALAAAS